MDFGDGSDADAADADDAFSEIAVADLMLSGIFSAGNSSRVLVSAGSSKPDFWNLLLSGMRMHSASEDKTASKQKLSSISQSEPDANAEISIFGLAPPGKTCKTTDACAMA